MKISKLNITNFKGQETNDKLFVIKPNNATEDADKSSLIIKGLIASGIANATRVLRNNNIDLKQTQDEKNTVITEQDAQENAETLKADENLLDDILEDVTIEENNQPTAFEEPIQEEVIEEVAEEEAIEEPQFSEILYDEAEDFIKEEQSQEAIEEYPDQTEMEEPDTIGAEIDKEDELPPDNKVEELLLLNAAEEEQPQSEEEIPAEIEEVTEVAKPKRRKRTKEEVHQQRLENHRFVKSIVKKNKTMFNDFGIDPKLLAEYRKLDNDLVKEIKEPEFLSLLLAPTENISLTFDELSKMYPRPSRIMLGLEDTVLRFTKRAKKHRRLGRKFRLNTFVKSINNTNERARRIKKLGKMFTAEDMKKIFDSKSNRPKEQLLNWLLEFHTKKADEQVFNYLDTFMTIN